MKCRLLRDCIGRRDLPAEVLADLKEQKRLNQITQIEFTDATEQIKPAGLIVDHPDAFRLVTMGQAEPADEECRTAAGMTPEQIQRAFELQGKVQAAQIRDAAHNATNEEAAAARRRQFFYPPGFPLQDAADWGVMADYWEEQGDERKARRCSEAAALKPPATPAE